MTRVKGSVFTTEDQGLFINFLDPYPTGKSNSAATNNANLTTLLATLTATGGVVVIPHGVSVTSYSFPVTSALICAIFLQGGLFEIKFNKDTSDFNVLNCGVTLSSNSDLTVNSLLSGLISTRVLEIKDQTIVGNLTTGHGAGYTLIPGSVDTDDHFYTTCNAVLTEAVEATGARAGRHYFANGVTVVGDLEQMSAAGDVRYAGITSALLEVVVPVAAGTTTPAVTTSKLVLDHTATIATHTINHPATPIDGQTFSVFSRSIITTLTLGSSASIATGHTITTLAALASIEWIWKESATKWYRIK